MTKFRQVIFGLFVVASLCFTFSAIAQAQIGSGGNKPGPGLLTIIPSGPIGPQANMFSYEVFNASPGNQVYIVSGFVSGLHHNLICPMTILNVKDFKLENILTANKQGYASAAIRVPNFIPREGDTFIIQALDITDCDKSNVADFDF